MYIVKVSPLTASFGKETLSYFSSKHIEEGLVISVPIRSKTVKALVTECDTASNLKAEIKSADFELKKIREQEGKRLFLSSYVRASRTMADYTVSSLGTILLATTPRDILTEFTPEKDVRKRKSQETFFETVILQTSYDERLSHYKNSVRESFARGQSIVFCIPTIRDAERLSDVLQKGIERYLYTFHSKHSKKEISRLWKEALATTHPVVIITTGGYLSLPRTDIGTYVIEHESSEHFKQYKRPYLDIRIFLEKLAHEQSCRLILGDDILSIKSLERYKSGELRSLAHPKFRYFYNGTAEVVDMNRHVRDPKKKGVQIFSDTMLRRLKETYTEGTHMVLFVARKGLYPITLCGDCGTTVVSEYSDVPVVLSESGGERFFICPVTGKKRSALETCKKCGSWNLITIGIGTERVTEELKKYFPEDALFQIDSLVTKTPRQAQQCVTAFLKKRGSVLVTTEMGLAYLDEPVDHTGVVTMDSLFALPDLGISEKIFHIIHTLRLKANTSFTFQIRNVHRPLLDTVMQGNVQEFLAEELKERKQFGYPPYSTLIRITVTGAKDAVRAHAERVEKILSGYTPEVYPSYTSHTKGRYTVYVLLKIPAGSWIDGKLLALLQGLPPALGVHIDPDSLL